MIDQRLQGEEAEARGICWRILRRPVMARGRLEGRQHGVQIQLQGVLEGVLQLRKMPRILLFFLESVHVYEEILWHFHKAFLDQSRG